MRHASRFHFLLAFASIMMASAQAWAQDVNVARIVTSTGISATMSTREIVPGGQMWVSWATLPPGKRVEFRQMVSKWSVLELVVAGSVVSGSNASPGNCIIFRTGVVEDAAQKEIVSGPGDGAACSYMAGSQIWEENSGTETFMKAMINIGGPPAPAELHMAPGYVKVGGFVQGYLIPSHDYPAVEKELIAAGAMTLSIRLSQLPPNARLVLRDRYPTVRFVTDGKVTIGAIAADADPATVPVSTTLAAWVPWPQRGKVVITNTNDKPVQFVEWSVTPADGVTP